MLVDVGRVRRVSSRSLGRYIKIALQIDNSEVKFSKLFQIFTEHLFIFNLFYFTSLHIGKHDLHIEF
jgi:hypothetical protein